MAKWPFPDLPYPSISDLSAFKPRATYNVTPSLYSNETSNSQDQNIVNKVGESLVQAFIKELHSKSVSSTCYSESTNQSTYSPGNLHLRRLWASNRQPYGLIFLQRLCLRSSQWTRLLRLFLHQELPCTKHSIESRATKANHNNSLHEGSKIKGEIFVFICSNIRRKPTRNLGEVSENSSRGESFQ